MRSIAIALACASFVASAPQASAQSAADGPLLRAQHLNRDAGLKVYLPTGHLRLVGWDRDSISVRGRVAGPGTFFFSGDSQSAKLGVEGRRSDDSVGPVTLVVYLPRSVRVSAKTVGANIDAAGVSGWFYTVSGSMHLSGKATSVDVESMNGNLDLDVTTPYLKARTGNGHLLIRGAPLDVDASTIGGTLDIAAQGVMRAQFGSVSGDIHYVGSPATGAIFEFSNHSGTVDLLLPQAVSGVFALSSVVGHIENGFTQVRPSSATPRSMRLSLGRGGSQVAIRTFKGTIRLRPQ
jgi:hypothetical protein